MFLIMLLNRILQTITCLIETDPYRGLDQWYISENYTISGVITPLYDPCTNKKTWHLRIQDDKESYDFTRSLRETK